MISFAINSASGSVAQCLTGKKKNPDAPGEPIAAPNSYSEMVEFAEQAKANPEAAMALFQQVH